jgi:hypothetical protein
MFFIFTVEGGFLMKFRFVLFAILIMTFTMTFSEIAEAKKIKITKDEAAALVTKFKAAHPEITIGEALTDCKAKGHDEKFHKSLIVNIKKWELVNARADDAAAPAEKREKAKENSAKLVEKLAQACAEASVKQAKAAAEPAPVPEVKPAAAELPAETAEIAVQKPAGNDAAKAPAKKASRKKIKKESEPEKYQPKTDRGQQIKDLLLGK